MFFLIKYEKSHEPLLTRWQYCLTSFLVLITPTKLEPGFHFQSWRNVYQVWYEKLYPILILFLFCLILFLRTNIAKIKPNHFYAFQLWFSVPLECIKCQFGLWENTETTSKSFRIIQEEKQFCHSFFNWENADLMTSLNLRRYTH